LVLGRLPPGPLNAITDVPGVSVGHATILDDPATPSAVVRTGVTVVLPGLADPFVRKLPAACHVINGFGKAAGLTQIAELGQLETPIVLTNTLAVGAGMLGLVRHAIDGNPDLRSVNPLVAECNDGWLNEITVPAVRPEHVLGAIAAAHRGPVAEGSVGAGTGMMCHEWKGGIGTASRVVPIQAGAEGGGADEATEAVVGILVLSNFGRAEDLCVGGVDIGRALLPPDRPDPAPDRSGSSVTVIATSAALDARRLGRLARRAQTGLARTGAFVEHGSGEYVIAFSTGARDASSASPDEPPARPAVRPRPLPDGPVLDGLFRAVVEATEEAVVNSLFAATTIVGRDGRVGTALPLDRVVALLRDPPPRIPDGSRAGRPVREG
jgi:D-aminopeptidase